MERLCVLWSGRAHDTVGKWVWIQLAVEELLMGCVGMWSYRVMTLQQ